MPRSATVCQQLLARWPALAALRNFHGETAVFLSSFRLQAAIQAGYAVSPVRFERQSPVLRRTSDVRLRCEQSGGDDEPLWCHTALLAARCPLLLGACTADASDSALLCVPSTVCAAKALPFLVAYLYTDRLAARLGDKLLAQLGRAAQRLRLAHLQDLCATAAGVAARDDNGHAAPSTLTSDMARLLADETRADVRLQAGDGEPVAVHKFVLASQSEYFRALLLGNMREASETVVAVRTVTRDALRIVVQFLYTRELAVDAPSILDVFEVRCVSESARGTL